MQTELSADAVSLLYALDIEPVIGVNGRTVRFLNPAAQRLFGDTMVGSAIRRLLPEHVALHQASAFFATARIRQKSYIVIVTTMPGLRIFRLRPVAARGAFPEMLAPSETFSMELGLASSFFDVYAEEHDDLTLRHYASRLARTTDQLRRWVNNTNVLQQLNSAPSHPEHTCNLTMLLAAIAEHAEPMLARRQQSLELSLPDSPCRVRMAPELFEQIVLNLLSNAMQAGKAGDTIRMRLVIGTRTARFTVLDHGDGFPEGVLPEAFQAYAEGRLPHTEQKHKGYGLPVCFAIADHAGGSLLIENSRSGGAAVHVILPLHTGAKAALFAPELPDAETLREACRIGLSDALECEEDL